MKRLTGFVLMVLMGVSICLTATQVQAGGASIIVTTTDDVDFSIDGQCSLREAIIAANSNTVSGFVVGECPAGSDTSEDFIVLTSGETYTLAIAGIGEDAGLTGDLDILDDLDSDLLADVVVTTDDVGEAMINGNQLDRVFHVLGATVRFHNVVIGAGSTVGLGGGIYNEAGVLMVENSQIIFNQALIAGGGIGVANGELMLIDSIVRANGASNCGGIGAGNSTVLLESSDVTLNEANQGGGVCAVFDSGGEMTVEGSSISNNLTHNGAGGGLHVQGEGRVVISQSDVSNNVTTTGANLGHGAGIYMEEPGSELHIVDSTVNSNVADAFGGGVFSLGMVVMTGTDVMSNTAVSGAGVHISEGQGITVTNGQFVGNQSLTNLGGAIYGEHVTVYGSLFHNNHALGGGAIYTDRLWAYDSLFTDNVAENWGGAVQVMAFVTIEDSHFVNNEAIQSGGAIMFTTNVAEIGSLIVNTVFDDNLVYTQNGGAIWTNGLLTIANSTLSGNAADESNGGGLFVEAAGHVTLTHVSLVKNVANNGRNIFKEGEVTLQNTLMANASPSCGAIATPFISLGNNLVDDDTCDGLDEVTDQTNVEAMVDWTLADNGGNTLTHALLAGSPAIDGADNTACEAEPVNGRDQRGINRTNLGTACDIGAYEYGASHLIYLPIVLK